MIDENLILNNNAHLNENLNQNSLDEIGQSENHHDLSNSNSPNTNYYISEVENTHIIEIDNIIDKYSIENNVILKRSKSIQILRIVFYNISYYSAKDKIQNNDFEIENYRLRMRTIVGNSSYRIRLLYGSTFNYKCEKNNYCLISYSIDNKDMFLELSDLFELNPNQLKSKKKNIKIFKYFENLYNYYIK
eukprot:Mrub_10337.p1 GENE.Mrub_10337~~Mrub_10337.p1  ORF type:complete len:206 (+),score=31.80 Mrub_10337:51-620(+)